MIRVQKFLSHQGIASRRSIEKMISQGMIKVNQQLVTKQGLKIDPLKDIVSVNDQVIAVKDETEYFLLHKPVGVVSTTKEELGRKTVVDLINTKTRLYPVGRLDLDSEGLILLTNDGELTHKLIHPKYHVPKTYHVLVTGVVNQAKIKKLSKGITLEEGMTLPAKVALIENAADGTWMQFILNEGKHRQIRRMCKAVSLNVIRLIRVAFGPLKLDIPPGEYRPLTQTEIRQLKLAADSLHRQL